MAKQTINIGSTANDGTGSTLRVGGDIINDNFNEIYTAFGDGSTLTAPLTAAGTATLTNKTIDLGGTGNVITGSLAEFNTALQGDSFVSLTGSETLTNKTLTSPEINTITRTGDFTLDVSGDISLDSDGATIAFKDGGTIFGAVINNSGELQLRSGASLGTAMSFSGANTTAAGNLTVTGNLTVNGTTTTVNSTNTTLDDNLLELNSGATSNANDTGIIMERGSTGDNAIIAWDESADKFVVGTTTATASDTGNLSITTGTLVGNIEGNVTGNITGNADTATALATGRTIGMTGDVVWTSASFDGSGNVTGVAALQANTVSSTELVSAVTLEIKDSGGSTVKTIIGAGS
tara:strand:+ start:12882 stop:13928 length:1047 start_codon:yes stop_codon:yes gene_type:complete